MRVAFALLVSALPAHADVVRTVPPWILHQGSLRFDATTELEMSEGKVGKPVSFAPDLWYGATDGRLYRYEGIDTVTYGPSATEMSPGQPVIAGLDRDQRDQRGPRRDADLAEDPGQMGFDGLHGDVEPLGDLGVARAGCDQPHDVPLASGQQQFVTGRGREPARRWSDGLVPDGE